MYTRILSRTNNFRILLNTGVSVDVASWLNAEKKSAGKANKSVWDFMPSETKKMVEEIDDAITLAMEQPDCSKESVEAAVSNVRYADVIESNRIVEEQEKAKKQAEQEKKKAEQAKTDADVMLYLSNLIEKMKNTTAVIERGQNVGEKYTKGTIKSYTNIQKVLQEFLKGKHLYWQDITKSWTVRFVNFMEKRGLMKKTVNRYATTMKAVITRAYEEGKHNDPRATKYFVKRKVDDTDKATEIYLTADEVNALYQMDLSGLKERVRDVFVVGCITCQRVSDYSTLRRENFTTTANGVEVVKLRQQKTGKTVTIPILDTKLKEITKKYHYQLPKVSDVIINRYIKEICKELANDVKSLQEELPTNLTMRERAMEEDGRITYKRDDLGRPLLPRWAMVRTHTARRTGITNLFISGKFNTMQMMSISGHSDIRSFKEYIRLSDEQMAEGISSINGNDDLF